MNHTDIEWATYTWNPVTGCDKISPGCDHCYAYGIAWRFAGRSGFPERPRCFDVTTHPSRLHDLRRTDRRKGGIVFAGSMTDLFHPDIPLEFLIKIYEEIHAAQNRKFVVMTKRPVEMLKRMDALHAARLLPMPHVIHMVTCENMLCVERRLPLLRQAQDAYGLPLIGVCLEPYLDERIPTFDDVRDMDWVILGGETGSKGRPMPLDVAHTMRVHPRLFFKGWGHYRYYRTDSRGGGYQDAATGEIVHFREVERNKIVAMDGGLYTCRPIKYRATPAKILGVEYHAYPKGWRD